MKLENYHLLPNYMGIYCIVNLLNNKKYIGYSSNLKERLEIHYYELKKGIHHNNHLQKSVNYYGIDKFEIKILEKINNNELLPIREQFYADFYQSFNPEFGYNYGPCMANPFKGKSHSQETKNKISKANSGKIRSQEHKDILKKCHTGKSRSVKIKEKIKSSSLIAHDKEKKIIKLISPDGKLIERLGIRAFCREFNLHRPNVTDLLMGRIKYHMGWRKYNDGDNLTPFIANNSNRFDKTLITRINSKKDRINGNFKEYWIKDIENGIIYKIFNISKFSRDHNIPLSSLRLLINNKMKLVQSKWEIANPANIFIEQSI